MRERIDGKAEMNDLPGDKGANLAAMTNLSIFLPPGFYIATEIFALYKENNIKKPKELKLLVESLISNCR